MRKYANQSPPNVKQFMQAYGHHIQRHEMETQPLTGTRLRQQFSKMKEGSAGLDGWSIRELRMVPIAILDMLATLLEKVEQTGVWPMQLATGFITLVPKGEGAHPLKLRPLLVLSLIYRAWGGIRVAEAMIWQEKWIHPLAHAHRRKCSTTDAAMLIATMIELARLVAKTIAGAGTDYAKCFDLVPQEISQKQRPS